MATNPFAFDQKSLTLGAAEKQLGQVKGGFTGSKEFPPNAMGHLHSTVVFSFVVPESVTSNQKLGKFAGGIQGQVKETAAAAQMGAVKAVGSTVGGVLGGLAGKGIEKIGEFGGIEATKGLGEAWAKKGQELGSAQVMNVTDSMITLQMPNSIEVADGASWAPVDADPSFIGLVVKAANSLIQGEQLGEVLKEAGFGMVKEMGMAAMNRFLAEGGAAGLAQAYTKSLENPFTDMAFQSMQRRNFRMSWQMFPKSASEMSSIKGIINMFRFHMHPNLSEGKNGNWLDFPSMVIPRYLFMGQESPFLPKIAMSVINNVTVNASPNGMWTVHSDGMPPHIQFSIELSEVQPLLKEDILAGY